MSKREKAIRDMHDLYCSGSWDECTKNHCIGIGLLSEAFDEGAAAMQEKCAEIAREPDTLVIRELREIVNGSRAQIARSIRALYPAEL